MSIRNNKNGKDKLEMANDNIRTLIDKIVDNIAYNRQGLCLKVTNLGESRNCTKFDYNCDKCNQHSLKMIKEGYIKEYIVK
jgi:DUF2075 family protein